MNCLLQVGNESLPPVKEFKYLRFLFVSEGTMEYWPKHLSSGRGIAFALPHHCDENRAELEGKVLDTTGQSSFLPTLVMKIGYVRKKEIASTRGRNWFSQESGCRLP